MEKTSPYATSSAYKELVLAELIQRTLAGDQDAFAIIFERYKNLVYRTAYLMLNESEEADETLQEVFLKVYRSLSTFQPSKAAFTTWLYRITINDCLNRRRKNRFTFLPLEWAWRDNHHALSLQDSRLQQDDDIHLALAGLSDKLRAVIVLRYYGELSYADIAESLDIPIGTIKSRLDLGLRTLRRELEVSYLERLSEKGEITS